MSSKNLSSVLSEILDNIKEDRSEAMDLLREAKSYLKKDKGIEEDPGGRKISKHQTVGASAAKYLEAAQRSNDQLVKVLGVLAKNLPAEKEGSEGKDFVISEDMRLQIYDALESAKEDAEEVETD